MESQKLTPEIIAQANQFAGYLSYQPNFISKALMDCDSQITFMSTGNRAGKTSSAMHEYVIRLLGKHPIERKNMRPGCSVRTLRFCSETLPMEPSGTGEVKNTIYPEFKKWFPPFLIKKEITVRKPVMTLKDIQGGADIVVEFFYYNQETQSQAGVDRWSVYLDEESPQTFYEEQIPRLITARTEGHGGDIIVGCTSTNPMTWLYDELYERANIIYRSPKIIEYLDKERKEKHKNKERTDSSKDIAIIMASTDDNPLLNEKIIDDMLGIYGDPDEMAVRRYGIFRQMSGSIFKQFDWRIHFIKADRYFPQGIPHNALHVRMIDYHQHVPWAITWAFLTNTDEMFVWNEWNPAPENFVTNQIVETMASQSKDLEYKINLIDPLASTVQSNTGTTVVDDINRNFSRMRREGYGTGGFWTTWDTKSPKGTDEIRKRLRNSVICGKPFSNVQKVNGEKVMLPTLWIFDTCKQTGMSLKNWRKKEYENKEMLVNNDQPDRANTKWSHFVMCLEGILKHRGFNYQAVPRSKEEAYPQPPKKEYFHRTMATR
jgi:hypothetical protein